MTADLSLTYTSNMGQKDLNSGCTYRLFSPPMLLNFGIPVLSTIRTCIGQFLYIASFPVFCCFITAMADT